MLTNPMVDTDKTAVPINYIVNRKRLRSSKIVKVLIEPEETIL